MNNTILILIGVTIFALIINLPFGYLRTTRRKLSFLWFFYIHVPIPFIILLRVYGGLSNLYIPLMVGAAVTGQLIGGKFNKERVS